MPVLDSLTLAALRAALEFGSAREVERVLGWWVKVKAGAHDQDLAALSADLIEQNSAHFAVRLARAEVARYERAKSLYLLARCLELAGREPEALSTFGRACESAANEGEMAILCAARVHVVRLLSRSESTFERSLAEATKIDRSRLRGEEALFVHTVLLRSPSRFVRAGAIASLGELAESDPAWCTRAVLAGADHADRRADTLSGVEAERLAALFQRWPDENQRDAVLTRFERQRARARQLDLTGERARVLIDAARWLAAEGERATAISYLREARATSRPGSEPDPFP